MDRCSDKGYCHLTKIMRKEMKEIDCCIITRFSIIDINHYVHEYIHVWQSCCACMYNTCMLHADLHYNKDGFQTQSNRVVGGWVVKSLHFPPILNI